MMKMLPINYQDRINRLIEMVKGKALVIFSQPEAIKNSDVHHSYRQESFFYYMTGVKEPDCALVICPHHKEGQSFLFVRPRDLEKEIWNGKRLGIAGAKKQVPVDEVFLIEDLWHKLGAILKGHDGVYYSLGFSADIDRRMIQTLNTVKNLPPRDSNCVMPVVDSFEIAAQMRHAKSEEEIQRMQIAADISQKSFATVFAQVHPGMNEKQVHGMIIGEFLRHGADMEAYNSIVASGENACCLHYVENDCELKDNELLLIDAGAQFDYYASDVTRTFPIGKKFTPAQKALYEIVLHANEEAIKIVKPGMTLNDVHRKAVDILVDGLLGLRLLKGNKESIIEKGEFKKYYPHNTGHWLGQDVHDVGPNMVSNGEKMVFTPFTPGMVITVEPGLYMPANDTMLPAEYRGIGIRIEDDVVVTKSGFEVLTKHIPKSIEAMENRT